jgi:ribosome-binding protein aMBF1 (putative translation factor)
LHPDGSHLVFKLLLKSYVKYADWHKKKGRNPIISFEDLVNRETGEKQDSTDDGRIRYLNEIIEKYEGEKNLSADELSKEIGELKNLILSIAQSNRTHSPQETLKDFKPKDGATLTKVEGPKPKKRLNYRDVRGKAGVKKIEF